MKDVISIYKKKRVHNTDLWRIKNVFSKNKISCQNSIAICIPVCNEYPDFFKTLDSIEKSVQVCNEQYAKVDDSNVDVTIFCAINSRKTHPIDIIENNNLLLQKLNECNISKSPESLNSYSNTWKSLKILPIDCNSETLQLPENDGVGLARKIAMDNAVFYEAELIACLDADTIVSENYIKTLFEFSKKHDGEIACAYTSFIHQPGKTDEQEKAIRYYEKFLDYHSQKLRECGFPFWVTALGPTIVCTSMAYAACNGMNCRVAGEDFYFLQSLQKTSTKPLEKLSCCVYPSSRISDRVLFGTGQKIASILENCDEKDLFYPAFVYDCISDVITLSKNYFLSISSFDGLDNSFMFLDFQKKMQDKNPASYSFLVAENFFEIWCKIEESTPKTTSHLERAFFNWFDGLKVIRFIHFLMR